MLPNDLKCSISIIKKISNANHIFCYEVKQVPPLSDKHKAAKVRFSSQTKTCALYSIAFCDDSMFIHYLYLGKIWHKRDSDTPQGTYVESKVHSIWVVSDSIVNQK